MQPRPADDPFDLGFDAEDEFATPSQAPAADPWADLGSPMGSVSPQAADPFAADPFAPAPLKADPYGADPFADFPPARPNDEFESPRMVAAPAYNPVHDLHAGVEAALGEAQVPRITIHVFCARTDTAEVIERSSADRRLSRASTVVRAGGLAAAVEQYQNQPTPSLVVVESLDPAPEMIAQLDRLAEVCDPGTKVMVIGNANDIALYRELMRRGVSEYLVPPLKPLQVISAIAGLYADPASPFTGRQIAFVGARGGSGASTLAHNVAWTISERIQAGTVIVDYDLAFGTAGLNFNHDPLQGVVDALGQPDRLDPVLMDRMMARCTDRLSLFAAPATLDSDYDIAGDAYEEVTQKIRAAAPYVVLDIPHGWNSWTRRMLIGSDDLVIVATPDLASLRNAKNMVDLVRQARPNDNPPRLVLNQVGLPGRPEIPAKDFGDALGIAPSMVIGFDAKTFGQAANNGQMIPESAPKSKAAADIESLAQLISRRDPPAVQKTSMLSGLFRKK
ncbi:pilus assembly protein CpaE [Caulobacter sp. SLTY]|uniref:AAA family ATPase n=1 Tax=Caulobacter sp. SLTY TaxID=2683262 RepID=UPI001413258A|nr:CpaE family protein [Caulobacter sp. SLTY]NBB16565.1 pilus assembly protein CpaE [Caulobacter sp. SLTY]